MWRLALGYFTAAFFSMHVTCAFTRGAFRLLTHKNLLFAPVLRFPYHPLSQLSAVWYLSSTSRFPIMVADHLISGDRYHILPKLVPRRATRNAARQARVQPVPPSEFRELPQPSRSRALANPRIIFSTAATLQVPFRFRAASRAPAIQT